MSVGGCIIDSEATEMKKPNQTAMRGVASIFISFVSRWLTLPCLSIINPHDVPWLVAHLFLVTCLPRYFLPPIFLTSVFYFASVVKNLSGCVL